MRKYLSYVNENLYGSEIDIRLRRLIFDGYTFELVMSAYGVSRVLNMDIAGLLTDKVDVGSISKSEKTELTDGNPINRSEITRGSNTLDARLSEKMSINEKRNYETSSFHTTDKLVLPDNMTFFPILAHSPELNPVEMLWLYIRSHYFKNDYFESIDGVSDRLLSAFSELLHLPQVIKSIDGWNWILDSFICH